MPSEIEGESYRLESSSSEEPIAGTSSLKYSRNVSELPDPAASWDLTKSWAEKSYEERFKYFKTAFETLSMVRSYMTPIDPSFRAVSAMTDAVFGCYLLQDKVRAMNKGSSVFFIERDNDKTILDKDGVSSRIFECR